jgi:U3 small nucleolar RNA-associated protein 18
MPRNARKRQKLGKEVDTVAVEPVLDDSLKDDEERRLESLIFGVPYKPTAVESKNILVVSDEEDDEDAELEGGGKEFEAVRDEDVSVFIVQSA